MGVGTAGFTLPFTKGLGYQQFTAVSGVITLGTTAPNTGPTGIPLGATSAVIAAEGQAIRWLDADAALASGAISASSTIGMPIGAGSTVSLQCKLTGLQIAPQVNGGTVDVWYGQ